MNQEFQRGLKKFTDISKMCWEFLKCIENFSSAVKTKS